MESDINITEIKESLNKNIIKGIIKYKHKIYKDENGYYLCLDDTGIKTHITGKFKCNDFDIMKDIIPWRKNHKSVDENKKRWNDFYSKVKELESKGIIVKLDDDDFFSVKAEKQQDILDKLKNEIVSYDDYYIEGEEGKFYSNKYDETERRLKYE
jgi:hypothetical protein